MEFQLLESEDAGWERTLEGVPHDVYHLAGYARVCDTHEPQRVQLGVVSSSSATLVAPVMLRAIDREVAGDNDLVDVVSPYGYPGPVCSSSDIDAQSKLFGFLLSGLREVGAVTAFIRCHPLIGIELGAMERFGTVVIPGEHVIVDVAHLPDPLTASFRADHRRGVRLLREAGYRIEIDGEGHLEAFPDLYAENMRRVGAEAYYLFPDLYFAALATELPNNLHTVAVIAPDGQVAAISLLLLCGSLAAYHLSATDPRFLAAAPAKLGIVGLIEASSRLGVERLNLGSGLGGRKDSLYEFKSGFSKARAPFATGRFVLNEEAYQALSGGGASSADFFPPYRHRG